WTAGFKGGGQEMGEAGLFFHALGEDRFEQGQRWRRGTRQDFDGGADEEVESDHGRDGGAGKAENGLALADGENYRFAGADGDGVEYQLGTEFSEDRLDQIVFAGGDSAGEDERGRFQAAGDSCAEVFASVAGVAQQNGQGVECGHLGRERNRIAVADLERAGRGRKVYDLVTCRKDRDSRHAKNRGFGDADLRGGGQLRKCQAHSFPEYGFAGALFAATRDDVLSRGERAVEPDHLAFASRVLDHDHGVRALGHGRSGHDLDAGARFNGAGRRVAGL